MICKSIEYYNFRNIEKERLELSPGVNVLLGDNAQGKSNMLEGIYFFARGRSFRGAKERELVRFGEESASLDMTYCRDGAATETRLSAVIPCTGKKTISRNGAKLSTVREMIGSFRAVLFCPAHLSLVDGGPSLRRSFLDIALSQLYPSYLESLYAYNRALMQRTALIKTCVGGDVAAAAHMLDIYAHQMAEAGARIAAKRSAYACGLADTVADIFSRMTDGRETPSLAYRSDAVQDGMTESEILEAGSERLYQLLTSSLEREIKYGAAQYGVHRDDIIIKLNSKDARLYASQGQRRSLVLAMKLAEGEMSRKICDEAPVFLLDDVLSELDGERRKFILSCLDGRQIVVTSCEGQQLRRKETEIICVREGRLVKSKG